MTKIITYIEKDNRFSRKANASERTTDYKLFAPAERIYAEQELDKLLGEGWQIISSSTYTSDSSFTGSTFNSSLSLSADCLTKLTIILHKP